MSKPDAPKFVTALYSFKGKNNDELCFKKGDTILITQTDDEGWWEGTLHDKTGWFPSNYVKECRASDSGPTAISKMSPEKTVQESPMHQKLNRDIVLKDIVDSERVNVVELQGLTNNFLLPLESANILTKEEYKQLLSNVHEILEAHQRLLTSLEAAIAQGSSSRVGNLFLTLAPKLKSIHATYCANHPRAVCILDRYRDELNEFMEHSGAISPGILVLTTGLSKPFRRLDKYSAMLQELERYMEKNHPDRGDTQRAISVYRDIAERCASIRKQRELALQVLTSGIKGWEGEELSSLGEILHVGAVTLASGTTGLDRRDRYFVLFPTTLLVLSASPRMSSFVYEGKLPLTGINIIPTEDSEEIRNAFEITGPMIESILVLCTTKEDRQCWIELLMQEQASSNLVKSPSTTSRVSCNLPPYTRLSRYFAKLVKRKLIRPELLKKLLYVQYVLKPDLSNVKVRRPNITTYALHPLRSSEECLSKDSDTTSSEAKETMENQRYDEPITLRKSTLTLEVKYALGDMDLSTVGITNSSTLTEFASDRNSPSESSKSLPVSVFARDPAVPDVVAAGYELHPPLSLTSVRDLSRKRPGDAKRHLTATTVVVSQEARVQEQQSSVVSVGRSINRTRSEDDEHRCDPEHETHGRSSIHSSDSGMVECYRLNSCKSCIGNKYQAGVPGRHSFYESENDENKFEHQCICTSPFDSTPRDSAHLSDLSRNADHASSSSICKVARPLGDVDETEVEEDVADTRPDKLGHSATQKRFTQPIPYAHQNVVKKVGRKPIQPNAKHDYGEPGRVYTSGLYAHWWLKKSIPISGCTDQGLQSTEWETTVSPATTTTTATTTIDCGSVSTFRD
ncbi:rho-type guanine nucleotide exchange factor isoform X1 [Halictus rubicundus]|uniref:rho-type guanine nucleotide exchange factor isoform X1 n=1 Tax=Halictus rubicundus TaxID=77578 RepID=UPI004035F7F0